MLLFMIKELFKLFPAFYDDYLISFDGMNGPVMVPPAIPPLVGLRELHSLVMLRFDMFIESFYRLLLPIRFLRVGMAWPTPAGI
jgi:hypothetical protein